jgi:hypothetical protein
MDKPLITIRNLTCSWISKLKLGREYNTPTSIGFSDEEYELLTCVDEEIKGTGSISHGYDHDNKDETKGLSLVQPKKCSCGKKLHFFIKECECGSKNFDYINDSRWGIDCLANFNYKIPKYHLWILHPETYNYNCKKFFLKHYIIDSSNEHFIEILNTQINRGKSKSKNFLPFSSDFYASNPIEKSSFVIVLDETYGVIVERKKVEKIVYNEEIIKKMSKIINKDFVLNKDIYLYEELSPYINIKEKITSHGKSRGKTTRREK